MRNYHCDFLGKRSFSDFLGELEKAFRFSPWRCATDFLRQDGVGRPGNTSLQPVLTNCVHRQKSLRFLRWKYAPDFLRKDDGGLGRPGDTSLQPVLTNRVNCVCRNPYLFYSGSMLLISRDKMLGVGRETRFSSQSVD